MTKNDMWLLARKIVADGPVTRNVPGKGIRVARAAEPGELALAARHWRKSS